MIIESTLSKVCPLTSQSVSFLLLSFYPAEKSMDFSIDVSVCIAFIINAMYSYCNALSVNVDNFRCISYCAMLFVHCHSFDPYVSCRSCDVSRFPDLSFAHRFQWAP